MSHQQLFAAVLPLFASACFFESDPDPVVVSHAEGLLTVTWTINGTTDPVECALTGADAISIVVEAPDRTVVTQAIEYCEASITSIVLPAGTYFADATMIDRFDQAVTTTVDLGRVRLFGNDELIVDADFPLDSFY
jgi:hypothetical protein